jgi:hypothetical protein
MQAIIQNSAYRHFLKCKNSPTLSYYIGLNNILLAIFSLRNVKFSESHQVINCSTIAIKDR